MLKLFRKPKIAAVFAAALLTVSCTTESTFTSEEEAIAIKSNAKEAQEDLSEGQIRKIFADFAPNFKRVQPNFERVIAQMAEGKTQEDLKDDPDMKIVVNELAEPGARLFRDLGFTEEQNMEMFGTTDIFNADPELVGGGALLLFTFQPEYQTMAEAPLAVTCFLEATGIAAGIGVIGVLAGHAGGAALAAAFTKVLTKVGIRTLSGIGLGLMVAEFAWCMLRD